jgi:hypothetical protein
VEQRFRYSWLHPCTSLQVLNLYDKLRSLCKGAMETFLRQNEVLCYNNAELEKQGQNLTADELFTVL